MVSFCDRVIAYASGHDLTAFLSDQMPYDATVRNLELIGEAATRIPADVRDAAPDIPWRQLIGSRNRLIHAYLGIDEQILWAIITRNVPALRDELLHMLARLGPG